MQDQNSISPSLLGNALKSKRLRTLVAAFFILSTTLWINSTSLFAGTPDLSFISRPLSKFILLYTDEGYEILSQIIRRTRGVKWAPRRIESLKELEQILAEPGFEPVRIKLEQQFEEIALDYEKILKSKSLERNLEREAKLSLTGKEQKALRAATQENLSLKNEIKELLSSIETPKIRLIPNESSTAQLTEADDLLTPVVESNVEILPEGISKQTVWNRTEKFLSEFKQCHSNKPPSARRSTNLHLFFSDLGFSMIRSATGYPLGSAIATGEMEVNWQNLPTDLKMAFINTSIKNTLMIGVTSLPLHVRWISLSLFDTGKTVIDAKLYFIHENSNYYGMKREDATKARLNYNLKWNLLFSTPLSLSIFEIVHGLECLYPGGKMQTWTKGIRFVYGNGSSIGYFVARERSMRKAAKEHGITP